MTKTFTISSLLLFFSLAFCTGQVVAQDLIVTVQGDSLHCRIISEKKKEIHFKFQREGRMMDGIIERENVADVRKRYFKEIEEAQKPVVPYSRWMGRLQLGYSHRLSKINESYSTSTREQLNKLRRGYVIGGDVHYFYTKSSGLGIKYSTNDYGFHAAGGDKVVLNYFGLSHLRRFEQTSGNSVFLGANLGYQMYKEKNSVNGKSGLKGQTLGLGLELGYGFKMSAGSQMYFAASMLSGAITKVKNGTYVRKLEKDEYEGLLRGEITVGITFGR